MTDFKEISELRPAPRRTPASVLWVMATIVLAGTGVLVFRVPGNAGDGAAQSAKTRGTYAPATLVARQSAVPKQPASPAK